MNFDSGQESFVPTFEGKCLVCGSTVTVRPTWRRITGYLESHEDARGRLCEGGNYEVTIIQPELPESVVSALSEPLPHGPNAGLLAARALERGRRTQVQMARLMRRPPRLS